MGMKNGDEKKTTAGRETPFPDFVPYLRHLGQGHAVVHPYTVACDSVAIWCDVRF